MDFQECQRDQVNTHQVLKADVKNFNPNSKCPFSLRIQYINQQLQFKWNFKNVIAKSSAFSRHILLFHYDSYSNHKQIHSLIKYYYKYMKLGDFMKIYYLGYSQRTQWIEKTNFHLIQQNFIKTPSKKVSFTRNWKNILKKAKYNQLLTCCVFTNEFNQLLEPFMEIVQNETILIPKLNFFYSQNYFQYDYQSRKIIVENYEVSNLKNYFHELNSVRAIHTKIRLSCMNGQIDLRKYWKGRWQLQYNYAIIRQFYDVTNSKEYCQNIFVENLTKNQLSFKVQFQVKCIDCQVYLIDGYFKISCCESEEYLRENYEKSYQLQKKSKQIYFASSNMDINMKSKSDRFDKIYIREFLQTNNSYDI